MTKRVLPNLIIAGVQRAGTSSLFLYLSQHPEVCASSIKETEYFISKRKIPSIEEYANFFKHYSSQRYVMEATPRYFYEGEKVAKLIYKQLGLIRIVVIFRNPIERLFSHFKHLKNTMLIPKDFNFDEFLGLSENAHKEANFDKQEITMGIIEGFYIDYLKEWHKYFKDYIKVLFFEDLKKNPSLLLMQLCKWLDINPSYVRMIKKVTVENRGILYKNEILHRSARITNKRLELFFRKHFWIKEFLRDIYWSINEDKHKDYISDSARIYLEKIYVPYNKRLYEFFSQEGHSNLPEWLTRYAKEI